MIEGKKDNNKAAIGLLVLGILTFIATFVGTSFSYLTASITGMDATPSIVTSAKIALNFDDNNKVHINNIVPGYTFVKKFSVNNSSGVDITYSLNWKNIINKSLEDLNYKVYKVNGDNSRNTAIFDELLISEDNLNTSSKAYSFASPNYENVVETTVKNATEGSAISANTHAQTIKASDGVNPTVDTYYLVFNLPEESTYEQKSFIASIEVILSNVSSLS